MCGESSKHVGNMTEANYLTYPGIGNKYGRTDNANPGEL